ncbi:MAG TPA: PIN domain-containing protein [Ignavibacteria bacterium]|nr:PIN domain-containing protein [Ignavibacteria bacterium]
MNEYVTDTMALILWLENRKFNKEIKKIFKSVLSKESKIYIPPICLAEIGYLSEKKKINIDLIFLKNYLEQNQNFLIAKLNIETFINSFKIIDIPELHDKLISGVAFSLGLPLITNDPVIINSKYLKTISF